MLLKVVQMVTLTSLKQDWFSKGKPKSMVLSMNNSLLHGDLEEEIYIEQLVGLCAQGEFELVYKLR